MESPTQSPKDIKKRKEKSSKSGTGLDGNYWSMVTSKKRTNSQNPFPKSSETKTPEPKKLNFKKDGEIPIPPLQLDVEHTHNPSANVLPSPNSLAYFNELTSNIVVPPPAEGETKVESTKIEVPLTKITALIPEADQLDKTEWSDARKNAFEQMKKNPNGYYYRFNEPGEEPRNGPWTDEEKQIFLTRLKEFGPKQWGLFSKVISGRVGYQCREYYNKLKKLGEIEDHAPSTPKKSKPFKSTIIAERLIQSEIIFDTPSSSPDLKNSPYKLIPKQPKKKSVATPKIPKKFLNELDEKRRSEKIAFLESKFQGKEIVPGLFLGGKHAAKNFDWFMASGVSVVVNAAKEVKNFHKENEKIQYHNLNLTDTSEENITQYFDLCCELLEAALSVKQEPEIMSLAQPAVLVHCAEGRSRSPSIIIAYLMKKKKWDLKIAYEHVLSLSPKLNINDGFKRQLMKYEKTLTQKSTLDFFAKTPRKCRTIWDTPPCSPREIGVLSTPRPVSPILSGLFATPKADNVEQKVDQIIETL